MLYANANCPFYKNKMGKSSFFFLKPWMNEQKISRILFVHPLKICEQYGFIQSCSYKSKALNRPWTI
ncbi:hypothetical protein EY666_08450 [Enterococcus faecalis]|uniref:Uncharacterized protein n=1 Tax=Enterococcus faecalis TaxID=1351 RepID=A0A4U3MCB2_ENTFL|nr:hypothetical protein EY666_08450 [Enterococcus faecalis]